MVKEELYNLFEKYDNRCAYCGKHIKDLKYEHNMTKDHIIPQSKFEGIVEGNRQPYFLKHLGINDVNHPDNLLPSCRRCNQIKGDLDLEQFRWLLFKNDNSFYFERE